MLFAIHAFEQRYDGMHGIESYEVIEADSYKEAEEYARDVSFDIISDYLYEEFKEEAEEDIDWHRNKYNESDFDAYISNNMEDDIDYEIWQVKDDTGYSLDALTNMFYNNPDEFVNIYCSVCE